MIAVRLAYHHEKAREPIQAARYLDMTVEIARAMGAWKQVAELSQRALALHATPERQMLLGYALHLIDRERG